MAICAVFDCDTVKDKRNIKNIEIKLHAFPRDSQMVKIWMHKCGRKDNINAKNAFICSKHFTKEQYRRNLQQELLNYTPKSWRNLRDDAVPTEEPPDLGDSVDRENNMKTYKVETVFLVEEHGNQEDQLVENTDDGGTDCQTQKPFFDKPKKQTVDCAIQCESKGRSLGLNMYTSREQELQEIIIRQQQRIESLQKEKESAAFDMNMNTSKELQLQETIVKQWKQIDALQKEKQSLHQQALKLTLENSKLRQECNATSNIFSETQKRKLRLGGARVQWTVEDIFKCAEIYGCGPEAYNFLLQKGYPFPPVITLKKFISKNRDQLA